jgi:FKBP-type peptidyl-prolyl cis-trans isomerase
MQTLAGYATTYRIIKPGNGKAVAKGAKVTVHATGVVKETGKKFWCARAAPARRPPSHPTHLCRSTKDPGQKPFEYNAGVGQVITGWDQGLLGMQLGEERELLIPAHEGYGAAGFPAWGIPPNGSLNFTLEVLKIE